MNLAMVNLGGGFPTKYLKNVPSVKTYGSAIFKALRKHFGNRIPETIIEPGRGMVGNAGVIEAEVVLVSKKSEEDDVRWVYLDIGKFGGLAETMDESIRYPIRTPRDGDALAPCVLAGPTCDSADVLYEKQPYHAAGQPGDRRQGADRRHRRLYGDLLVGGVQRLSAAEDLPHLTSTGGGYAASPSRISNGPALVRARLRAPPGGEGTAMITIRRNGLPTSRRARRCSTRPSARPARARPPSGCAKAGCRPKACASSPPRASASSARCGCGTSLRQRPSRRCCSARWRSTATAATAASGGHGAPRGREAARKRGHAAIVLVGDAPYYSRFGFSAREDRRPMDAGPVRAASPARA